MKYRMASVKFMVAGLSLLSGAMAEAGNCQHPYCGMSSGYDAEHGVVDLDSPVVSANVPVPGETAADRLRNELQAVGAERFTTANYKPGRVRHIVLFRYAADVTAEQKAEVKRRFLALRGQALRDGHPYIVSIEAGEETSGEGADQGLEHGFIVTFRSQGDRNFYVGKPVVTESGRYDLVHQAFKDFVGPLLDQNGAVVFDF